MTDLKAGTENILIENFWKWFSENNKKYMFMKEIENQELRNTYLSELLTELHKFCDELYISIGNGSDVNEKSRLIITAEGITEHFPKVEEIVEAAPEFDDWNIIAFRQPTDQLITIKVEGEEFDPSKIMFIPEVDEDMHEDFVGLSVCFSDYAEERRGKFITAVFILLDSLIGEKATSLDIDYLDVIETPENILDFDFRYLSDIEIFINEKKQKHIT